MYLCVLTKSDNAFAVSFLYQHINCFAGTPWIHLKRILKYSNNTKNFRSKYVKGYCISMEYLDTDWASYATDGNSYAEIIFTMCGSEISYQSRKQNGSVRRGNI